MIVQVPAVSDAIEWIRSAKHVWLTGHSLGGALASIAAAFLLREGVDVRGVYTYGTPRVGNAKYRDDLNRSLTHRFWRFLYEQDIVPDVPFPGSILGWSPKVLQFGFSREGCMLRLTLGEPEVLRTVDKDGIRKVWNEYTGESARDHSMALYRQRLFDLISSRTGTLRR